MKSFRCRRYSALYEAADLRKLTDHESRFMDEHVSACSNCATETQEFQLALNMLRVTKLDAAPSGGFDERLLRRLRVQEVKGSVRYWSPMFLSAALAGLVLIAALHMLTDRSTLSPIRFGGNQNPEARRVQDRATYPIPIINTKLDQ